VDIKLYEFGTLAVKGECSAVGTFTILKYRGRKKNIYIYMCVCVCVCVCVYIYIYICIYIKFSEWTCLYFITRISKKQPNSGTVFHHLLMCVGDSWQKSTQPIPAPLLLTCE